MKKKIFIFILIALLALGGIMLFPKLFKRKGNSLFDENGKFRKDVTLEEIYTVEEKHGELTKVSYSSGGGMNGETFSEQIARDKEGNITGIWEKNGEWGLPLRTYIYSMREDVLDDLMAYIDEYHLSVWDKLPFDEEHIALDAPSTDISMTFNDESIGGNRYEFASISYDDVIPSGGYPILNEFSKMISREFTEENIIDFYYNIDGKPYRTGRDEVIDEDTARKMLGGYWMSEKKTVTSLDGETEETLYDMETYYGMWTASYMEEWEIYAGGMDEPRRIYDTIEILMEPYGSYDASWHAQIRNEDGSGDAYRIIMEGDKLYLDKDCSDDDAYESEIIVFRRMD